MMEPGAITSTITIADNKTFVITFNCSEQRFVSNTTMVFSVQFLVQQQNVDPMMRCTDALLQPLSLIWTITVYSLSHSSMTELVCDMKHMTK
jgi:hypothetical protein